jgi:hypothetical protein
MVDERNCECGLGQSDTRVIRRDTWTSKHWSRRRARCHPRFASIGANAAIPNSRITLSPVDLYALNAVTPWWRRVAPYKIKLVGLSGEGVVLLTRAGHEPANRLSVRIVRGSSREPHRYGRRGGGRDSVESVRSAALHGSQPAAASDQGRIADRRLGGRNHAIELDSDFAVARLSLNAQSYMAQYSPAIDAAIL